ncbi:unannotated protein [freshwater metagenome]|uniref:Unannotated protein n=1 Tax=freshwater metagenome TaxID=449393 RepID=A0A6J6EJX3_9ZZZZ
MDFPALNVGVGERRIEGLADDIEHMAKHCFANGNRDAATGVAHWRATTKTISGLHGDNTHSAVADLLSNL